jgi:Protein of unknown function (DUF3157)
MKLILSLVFVLFVFLQNVVAEDQIVSLPDGHQVVLHDDFTWEYYQKPLAEVDVSKLKDSQIPSFLRSGIQVDKETLAHAVELHSQGWKYTMPQPKSRQAAWGNGDRRTTWWYGYWENEKTGVVSEVDPAKRSNGIYYGDSQNLKMHWRNGGSPPLPTKLEWLLSTSGGIPPQ